MEDICSELEEDTDDGKDNLIYINAVNKHVNTNEDIPLRNVSGLTREYDCMEIIKSTIELLHDQIEFLKEEIKEKNLLIKMLNYRNANNGDKINVDLMSDTNFLSNAETSARLINDVSIAENTPSVNIGVVDYDETKESNLSDISNLRSIHEPIQTQITNYQIKQSERYLIEKNKNCSMESNNLQPNEV